MSKHSSLLTVASLISLLTPLGVTAPSVAQCGGVTADCCTSHPGAGCGDAECCGEVCKVDSYCCEVQWDGICAQLAQGGCDRCGGSPLIITAFGTSATLPGGVVVAANDLAAYDPVSGTWSLYFDGSDVGLGGTISAATKLPNGDLLIATTSSSSTLAGLSGGPSGNTFTRNDLLRFVPATLGEQTTGSWSFYFDGSDVGLTTSDTAINGISRLNDGSLVLAFVNGGSLPGGVTVVGQDLARFVPSSLGSTTSGSWSLYTKGANLGLTATGHKLDGGFVRQDGSILLSTSGTTAFLGFQARADIVAFSPTNLGASTSGSLDYYLRAYEMGLASSGNIRSPFLSSKPRLDGPRGPGGPPSACGLPGDCCAEQTGAGCQNVDCCEAICALDPYCCEVRWDEYCVLSAQVNCEPCVPGPKVIVTVSAATTLPGGVAVTPSDLAQYDVETGEWSLYFKGSNVGLAATIAAAAVLPDGDILVATIESTSLVGLTGGPSGSNFTRNDILRFRPVNLGASTSGSWSFYFDGSDVGLSSSGTAIRALAVLPDGRLVIGTSTGGTLTGVGSFTGSDLVVFAPSSLGSVTTGTFAPYFRGGPVGLTTTNERLDYAFVNSDGMLLLSTRSSFSVNGNVTGTNADLLAFFPDALGDSTAGVFGIYVHGVETGIATGADLRGGFVLYPVVPLMPRPDVGDGGGGGGGGGGDGGGVGEGWTQLTPSIDPAAPLSATSPLNSRLIYVDSVGGNDAAAAAAKGRGFYLPSDPEIGPDPTNPVGPIVAYATAFEAHKRLRLSNSTGVDGSGFPVYGNNNPQPSTVTGFPDWILLKRGGNYAVSQQLVHPNSGVTETYNLGMLLGGHQQPTVGWSQAENRLVYWAGPWRGRSASEPSVVAAWGPTSDPRPIVNGFNIGGGTRHVRVVSLDLTGREMTWGWGSDGFTGGGVLIEDCTMRSLGGISMGRFSFADGVTVRRCVVTGNFNPGGHNQGFFLGSTAANPGHVFTIEECVFDRNGYKEDPNQPQTWTARTVSALVAGELPAGTGVQPTRTYYDRNLYMSSYADLKIRGSIISRGGGGSNVQMRQGGVCERNLFVWCQASVGTGHPEATTAEVKSSLLRQNVVLHDDCFLPPGGSGIGLSVSGASDDVAVLDDNVIAHFHRGTNGGESINVSGKSSDGQTGREPSPLMLGVVKDNAIFQQNGAGGIVVERSSSPTYPYVVLDADVTGNEVSATRILSGQGDGTKPATYSYSGNKFHSTGSSATWFLKQWTGQDYRFFPTYVDLAGWKAAGFDADVSAVSTDLAAFKTAVGWTAPERDILTYMQSVDPTYVVNEDVYVDDDSTGPKQATRQKVWQVLMQNVAGGGMTESHAKLTARRYHAFITFIQRAKANRKGAWDPRWTADAVNDYIRDGFGKPSVRPGLGN